MICWSDRAIVLGRRSFGENDAIIDVLGAEHGRRRGLVRGGAGRRRRCLLEPGNLLQLEWRGRLHEHLGYFVRTEPLEARAAACFGDPVALSGLNSALALLTNVLALGLPKPDVFASMSMLLAALGDRASLPSTYIHWEAQILTALGYGLDLDRCAVTGRKANLTHVSPRSGRAVSAEIAAPYSQRLLLLPAFMLDNDIVAGPRDIGAGFALTGYFIRTRLLAEHNLPPPEARALLSERMIREQLLIFPDPAKAL